MARIDTLEAEARRIGRYLVGADLPSRAIDRYREANLALFPEGPSREDAAILEFVRRHPWSLAPLESAQGLIRPTAILRSKLVLLMAILETEPQFVGKFDSLAPGPVGAVLRLIGLGFAAACKIAAGLLLYPLAKRLGSRSLHSHDPRGA